MTARIAISILLAIVLTGCVTSQKQRKEKQQISDRERGSKIYYEEEISSSEYESPAVKYLIPSAKPAEKKSAKPVQLSVRQIQKALKNAGYYEGSIDGVIGPKTKSAILKFQSAHDLKADGIVGKNTSAKLNEYLYR